MHELGIALLLALRIGLPGWLWLGRYADESPLKASRTLALAGRAIPLGFVLNLLPALCVAQLGLWTQDVDWSLWTAVCVAGAVWRSRRGLKLCLCDGLGMILFLASCSCLLLLLPARSEWIAGGWDPGLYQNFAVVVSKSGGFCDIPSIYSQLEASELALFGPEVFPGVPLDHASGMLQHYFFQLMPMCGAFFHRMGGLDLLFRVNQLLAFFAIPSFFAFIGVVGIRGWRRLMTLALFCVSPMWLYHQAVPTTEMLQLLLLLGAVTLYADSLQAVGVPPIRAAILLAAIGINHFGFPALLSIVLMVVAVAESYAQLPGRQARLITCAIGLGAGLAWDIVFSSVTLVHLQAKDNAISLVLAVFACCMLWAAASRWVRFGRPAAIRVECAARWVGAIAGSAIAVLALFFLLSPDNTIPPLLASLPVVGSALLRLRQIWLFHDPLWLFVIGLGVLGLSTVRGGNYNRIRAVAAGFGGVTIVLLLNPGIAPIYPWALRRYFVLLLPLVTLLSGSALTIWPLMLIRGRERLRVSLAVLLGFVILGLSIHGVRKSARVGDYVGYRDIVESIDSQIEDSDIIVADDARIGTPLLLIYGRNVINGEILWGSTDADVRSRFLATLSRLKETSCRRILWLTSTERGMDIYPAEVGVVASSGVVNEGAYRTVIHSARADGFRTRGNMRKFQLHVWRSEK